MELVLLFVSLGLVCVSSLFIHLCTVLWLKPERLRSKLQKQGIRGPPPTLLLGNIPEMKRIKSTAVKAPIEENVTHNCASILFPFFEQWRNKYGPIFKFSLGNIQILYVTQPDVVKEISLCTSLALGKPMYQHKEHRPLLGNGILTSNGERWSLQRRIIAPELYMEKVKGMVNLMVGPTISLVNSWKSRIESEGGIGEIKIDEDLRSFSGEVISRACFGSNFFKGRKIFSRLRALQEATSMKSLVFGIPGMRFLPTKSNRERWRLEKEIHSLFLEAIKERKEATFEKNLLQKILEGANNNDLEPDSTEHFIVDNCKNICLAGYETTAVSAAWSLMLLALDQEWQARVRAEVLDVCGGQVPDINMLRKMKLLKMVIQEALRLYPPVAVVSREALKDMKFGGIHVPKGVNLWTLVVTLHQDPEIWGPDANKFNPERFANGITGACKLPHVYMPFGVGPHTCLGENFAMVELKILLAQLLSNFSFSLSPNYSHSPALRLLIEPEHGVNLLMKNVT